MIFFSTVWRDTQDTQDLISKILMDIADCIDIFLKDLVDHGYCPLSLCPDPMDLGSRKSFCCGVLWILDLKYPGYNM